MPETITHKYIAGVNLSGTDKRCDFCWSGPKPFRRYDCKDFKFDYDWDGHEITFESRSHWAACAECAALVEKRDVWGLVLRACKGNYGEGNPVPLHYVRHTQQTFGLFFENREKPEGE